MKSFTQKKEELAKLKDKLAKAKLTVFTSFARAGEKGLNVTEIQNLKKALRAVNAEYLVGKKTLIDKALGEKNLNISTSVFDGSSGLAFGFGDEAGTAKILYTFSKKLPNLSKFPKLRIFGALFGERFIDDKNFIELAKLPNRETMLGRTAGMIKYPLTGLVNVLRANIQNLVGVLNQISSKK